MSSIKMIALETPEDVGNLAADLFELEISAKPNCVLGLATGSTPLPLYRQLIERNRAQRIDFSQVKTFNLDEYEGLSPEHPQSYRHFMQENLFNHINIKPENTHVPDGLTQDCEAMFVNYERQISNCGGIDLQLLGIGHDGHIGFNEPSSFFPSLTHKVTLTELTRQANKRFFHTLDEVPLHAYTMGIGTIMAARKIIILVTGRDKADILHRAFFDPVTPHVPASVLQFHHDVTLICDREAALV